MLDMPVGPPVDAGGGGGVLPPEMDEGEDGDGDGGEAEGEGEEGWPVGIGVVGWLPAGWLKEGCSGGLGSDMASFWTVASADL
ncbi:hypothetical protein ACFQU3_22960 [Terrabacter sp. GCM10028922]|uniref:hypothetical protein n=1 Tax=Terrabacter sp. GCM10028922 TaxID=3273428 RepID=UPI003611BC98